MQVPDDADATTLRELAQRHATATDRDDVFEAIAEHRAADADVLQLLLTLAPDSPTVANAVTMSPRATEASLRGLTSAPWPGVRDHAEMALLERELAGADPSTFVTIVARFEDHPSLPLGVRHRIATHPRTPVELLRSLADHDDAAGEAARARLRAMKS